MNLTAPSSAALAARGVGVDGRRGADPILDGISLEILAGQLTVVTGQPDEAKSALIRVLAGLRMADRGSVWSQSWDARGLGDPRVSQLRTGEAAFVAGASRVKGWGRLGATRRRDPSGHLAAARQVTAVERALTPVLRTLFADLDPDGERESLDAVAHWTRSHRRTAVVAVTDPRAAIAADRVLVLGHGRLIGDLDKPERRDLASMMELAGSG